MKVKSLSFWMNLAILFGGVSLFIVGCSALPQSTQTVLSSPEVLLPQPTNTWRVPTPVITPTLEPSATPNTPLVVHTRPLQPTFTPSVSQLPTPLPTFSPTLWPQAKLLATMQISSFPQDRFSWRKPSSMDWTSNGKVLACALEDSVWVVQGPDYEPVRLINIPTSQIDTVYWSPDDLYLAISGLQQTTEEMQGQFIWVAQADGTGLKKLSPDIACFDPYHGHWINQWLGSDTLAIECWRMGLVQVDINDDQVAVLTDATENSVWSIRAVGGSYYWSPTQKHVVINSEGHLVLVDIEQGKERWFSSLEEWPGESFHGWSRDGQQFLYSKWNAEKDQFDLWLWDVASQTGGKLISHANQGALSPDGTRIVFLRQENYLGQVPTRIREDVYPEQWPPALTAGMLEIDTGATILYGPAGYRADEGPVFWEGGQPAWSPDGELVAYWGEDSDIWVTSADGTWQQRLTWGMEIIQVLWSPDGTRLALRTFDRAWIIERPGQE